MKQLRESLVDILAEAVLQLKSKLPTWRRGEAKPQQRFCDLQVSDFEDSNDLREPHHFIVNSDYCKDHQNALRDAEELLQYWEDHAETWPNPPNARELNRAGCLYVWVRKNHESYETAKRLFEKAREEAKTDENMTDKDRAMIESNLALVEDWLS
jgi:hypothetical protein